MSVKECHCNDPLGHARALESAIMQALFNAQLQPEREDYWRAYADRMESKYTTMHGRHYSLILYPNTVPSNAQDQSQ